MLFSGAGRIVAALLLATVVGCGDDDSEGDNPAPTPTAPIAPRPGPGAIEGTVVLTPISSDEYDALANLAAEKSSATSGCQGDPFGGTVQVCQFIDTSTDPISWIAIGGNAAAAATSDGAEAVLFFGNDADGGLAVAMATVASNPNITGFWKATWQMPAVTLQFGTTTNFVAAFQIGGRELAEVCMLPYGATSYTCSETHL